LRNVKVIELNEEVNIKKRFSSNFHQRFEGIGEKGTFLMQIKEFPHFLLRFSDLVICTLTERHDSALSRKGEGGRKKKGCQKNRISCLCKNTGPYCDCAPVL